MHSNVFNNFSASFLGSFGFVFGPRSFVFNHFSGSFCKNRYFLSHLSHYPEALWHGLYRFPGNGSCAFPAKFASNPAIVFPSSPHPPGRLCIDYHASRHLSRHFRSGLSSFFYPCQGRKIGSRDTGFRVAGSCIFVPKARDGKDAAAATSPG